MTLTFRKCKYTNRKPIWHFAFYGNIDVGPICHHFTHIDSLDVHDPDLASPLEWTEVKSKIDKSKTHMDFIFYGNSNAGSICEDFEDLHNRNLPDLDLENGPNSNVNMLLESIHLISNVTSYLMFAYKSPF